MCDPRKVRKDLLTLLHDSTMISADDVIISSSLKKKKDTKVIGKHLGYYLELATIVSKEKYYDF